MWNPDCNEILGYARRAGLSDSEFLALSNEITAASALPQEAMRTAMKIALAKYPQTREMVRRLASDPTTGTLRGEWLSRSDWIELDTAQTEADDLARRFLNKELSASDLNEDTQVAVVRELLLGDHGDMRSNYGDMRIMRLLDLSPSAYERIRQRVEADEQGTER